MLCKNWLDECKKQAGIPLEEPAAEFTGTHSFAIHKEFTEFVKYFSMFPVIRGNYSMASQACIDEHEARSEAPVAEAKPDSFDTELRLAAKKGRPRKRKARWEPMVQVKMPEKHLYFSQVITCD